VERLHEELGEARGAASAASAAAEQASQQLSEQLMAPERLAEAQMDRDRLERELRESQLEIDALRARAEAAVSSAEIFTPGRLAVLRVLRACVRCR